MKAGTKQVEGRTLTSWETIQLKKLKARDKIIFTNNSTNDSIQVTVKFVHHYKDVATMLENEGVERVLSSFPKTFETGVKKYHSIPEYKEAIPKYGIYAIGVELEKKAL